MTIVCRFIFFLIYFPFVYFFPEHLTSTPFLVVIV